MMASETTHKEEEQKETRPSVHALVVFASLLLFCTHCHAKKQFRLSRGRFVSCFYTHPQMSFVHPHCGPTACWHSIRCPFLYVAMHSLTPHNTPSIVSLLLYVQPNQCSLAPFFRSQLPHLIHLLPLGPHDDGRLHAGGRDEPPTDVGSQGGQGRGGERCVQLLPPRKGRLLLLLLCVRRGGGWGGRGWGGGGEERGDEVVRPPPRRRGGLLLLLLLLVVVVGGGGSGGRGQGAVEGVGVRDAVVAALGVCCVLCGARGETERAKIGTDQKNGDDGGGLGFPCFSLLVRPYPPTHPPRG